MNHLLSHTHTHTHTHTHKHAHIHMHACTYDPHTHLCARAHTCNAIRLTVVALDTVWHFLALIPFLHFTGTAPAFMCICVNVWTLRPGHIVHHPQTCTCVPTALALAHFFFRLLYSLATHKAYTLIHRCKL